MLRKKKRSRLRKITKSYQVYLFKTEPEAFTRWLVSEVFTQIFVWTSMTACILMHSSATLPLLNSEELLSRLCLYAGMYSGMMTTSSLYIFRIVGVAYDISRQDREDIRVVVSERVREEE